MASPLGHVSERLRLRLRDERKARGLTHAQLQELLTGLGIELHRTALSEIETGGRRVTVDELMGFSEVLAVCPLELLGAGAPQAGAASLARYTTADLVSELKRRR